ncbi:Putative Acyl transferase domain superfamily, Acyl transferase/acyl hydrolase/lysophospholipase [Colletotrichum destructivum]|uniref:Acyl transferase domain superfamily, Acyl transferase/acyl hydrolase/lysophospholipase n=1 Tax=Colletotrichum destructivum TaxID=34406 RepID=A0AAX4J464_9PEZI|nr:Putative Acyl transferase domain superfamily, Acyl transferase/acyl hydrolase/lysophospholipase [Colletotrichum destructivum]
MSENASSEPNLRSSTITRQERPLLLGVFTGQGAQWPGMIISLILAIPHVRDIVVELAHSLQTLPVGFLAQGRGL